MTAVVSNNLLITGAEIITPDNCIKHGSIRIVDRLIKQVSKNKLIPRKRELHIDASRLMLLPGFIDVHNQGGGGGDTYHPSEESLSKMAGVHAKHGTTSILATISSDPFDQLKHRAQAIAQYMKDHYHGARFIGIHLEGPFLNPARHGMMNQKSFLKPDVKILKELYDLAGGNVKLITLAPELPGADALIRWCKKRNIAVAIGHSEASFEEAARAIKLGARHFTHLFNASIPINHRKPGLITQALISPEVTCEIICDLHHLHPAIIRFVYKNKGASNILLVTDSIKSAASNVKSFIIHGKKVCITKGAPRSKEGTLAGSILTQDVALRNFIKVTGASLREAVRTVTINPAKLVGMDDTIGRIAPGYDGDVVLVDKKLNVMMTIVQGAIVFKQKSMNI